MDPYTKDLIDAISKCIGLLSVFVAIFVAWHQFEKNRQETERNRLQRNEELRWRKAGLGRDVLNEFWEDSFACDAMLMLDWTRRGYCIGKEQDVIITLDEVWHALRVSDTSFTEKEKYVRDCFDHFFGMMQIIEHYLSINLIVFEDVNYPFNYYAGKLKRKREVIMSFLQTYEYDKALVFLSRFDNWRMTNSHN